MPTALGLGVPASPSGRLVLFPVVAPAVGTSATELVLQEYESRTKRAGGRAMGILGVFGEAHGPAPGSPGS